MKVSDLFVRLLCPRYVRIVPLEQRKLIRDQRLPRPNWYVGSAEGGRSVESLQMDPALERECDELKRRIRERHEGRSA